MEKKPLRVISDNHVIIGPNGSVIRPDDKGWRLEECVLPMGIIDMEQPDRLQEYASSYQHAKAHFADAMIQGMQSLLGQIQGDYPGDRLETLSMQKVTPENRDTLLVVMETLHLMRGSFKAITPQDDAMIARCAETNDFAPLREAIGTHIDQAFAAWMEPVMALKDQSVESSADAQLRLRVAAEFLSDTYRKADLPDYIEASAAIGTQLVVSTRKEEIVGTQGGASVASLALISPRLTQGSAVSALTATVEEELLHGIDRQLGFTKNHPVWKQYEPVLLSYIRDESNPFTQLMDKINSFDNKASIRKYEEHHHSAELLADLLKVRIRVGEENFKMFGFAAEIVDAFNEEVRTKILARSSPETSVPAPVAPMEENARREAYSMLAQKTDRGLAGAEAEVRQQARAEERDRGALV